MNNFISIATVAIPGIQLITTADLEDFWRSDRYGELSKGVLSPPAFVVDVLCCEVSPLQSREPSSQMQCTTP